VLPEEASDLRAWLLARPPRLADSDLLGYVRGAATKGALPAWLSPLGRTARSSIPPCPQAPSRRHAPSGNRADRPPKPRLPNRIPEGTHAGHYSHGTEKAYVHCPQPRRPDVPLMRSGAGKHIGLALGDILQRLAVYHGKGTTAYRTSSHKHGRRRSSAGLVRRAIQNYAAGYRSSRY
jgi:hypothetical protein